MGSVELEQHEKHNEETFADNSLPLDSSGANDCYGEPLIPARIGDCYQVYIPSLITKMPHLHLNNGMLNHEQKFRYTNEGTHENGPGNTGNDKESPGDANYIIVNDIKEKLSHPAKLPQDCSISDYQVNPGYNPLLDLPVTPWSEAEAQSFLLGLYIFGKNLAQVRKFVECRSMRDILSYYYGTFYKSDTHRIWAECKKIISRKCIRGQRIFTGWRQRELLSRILPKVTKDVQDGVQEATKAYNDRRSSLEEYILILKATVGTEALVKAVGIGKGEHDLTDIITGPVRTNQVPTRPEIPMGTGDIIKFLKGDFRLSKARSNELFWEAVWPRLLERGWHSEKPKAPVFFAPKDGLVFLVPGVKKFSRKRLVRGENYLDSVCDVLNKVAEDPRLIEFEVEGDNEISDNKDKGQGHRYLRPVTFTNVDTRGSPESAACSTTGASTISGESTSGNSEEEPENTKSAGSQSENRVIVGHLEEPKNTKKAARQLKRQLSRSVKSGHQDELVPLPSRRRLNPRDREGTMRKSNYFPIGCELKEEHAEVLSSRAFSLTNSSSNCSPEESGERALSGEAAVSQEKAQMMPIPDLYLPFPMGFDTDDSCMEMEGRIHDTRFDESRNTMEHNLHHGGPQASKAPDSVMTSDQMPSTATRRQSTRNRSLTTRVFEALSCGFLGMKKKRRRTKSRSLTSM